MTVETSALYRIERALGLHALRRVAAWWALARAQRAWKVEPWRLWLWPGRLWLRHRRKALSAALGPASVRSRYSTALRNVRDYERRESPQAKLDRAVTNAGYDEADRRRELLEADRQVRRYHWAVAAEGPRLAALVVLVPLCVGAWVTFAVWGSSGDYSSGWAAVAGMLWLTGPAAVGLLAWTFWLRARADLKRHENWSDRLTRRKVDYDKAWFMLRDAERAAGHQWGRSRVIAPYGLPDTAQAGPGHRPSVDLLAVPYPDLIDDEANRLADDTSSGVERLRADYRRKAEQGERSRRTWSDAGRLAADQRRLSGDAVRGWGAFEVPAEHAGAFGLGLYPTVRERADELHGGR